MDYPITGGSIWTNTKTNDDYVVLGMVMDANNVATGFEYREVLYMNSNGEYFHRGEKEFRRKFVLKVE